MQINIDKKTGIFLGVIVLLVAAIFSITINKDRSREHMGSERMRSGMMNSSTSANYTGADIMFLQMMIPHHQQAVDMSNLALKTTKDTDLLALAKTIKDAQSAEIIQMKNWLKDAGASTDMGHEMSGMGGMLTNEEYSKLTAATGAEFVQLWLEGMIGHHDGAIHMTQMIVDADNPEIKAFGENVVKVQTAEIAQMKAMLKK